MSSYERSHSPFSFSLLSNILGSLHGTHILMKCTGHYDLASFMEYCR